MYKRQFHKCLNYRLRKFLIVLIFNFTIFHNYRSRRFIKEIPVSYTHLIQDGISYLPIRAVGELTGMQVSWTNQGGIQTIYLTTKSSDEEIQQARAYLTNIRPHIEIIKKSGEALKSATDLDTMSLNLKVIQEENDKIQSMAVPDGKLMDVYAKDIYHECNKIQQVCTEILTLVNNKADVSTCIDAIWGETAEHFQHAQILIGHYLENVLDQAERVLVQQ